jgi:hypothetical protein
MGDFFYHKGHKVFHRAHTAFSGFSVFFIPLWLSVLKNWPQRHQGAKQHKEKPFVHLSAFASSWQKILLTFSVSSVVKCFKKLATKTRRCKAAQRKPFVHLSVFAP